MITFASFHATLTPSVMKQIKSVASSFLYYEPDMFLNTMFDSAELFNPGCKKVVLTDLNTPISLPPEIEIHRFNVNPSELKYAIVKSRIEYLKKSGGSSHIIFLDSDILIQANLASTFQQEFDVAVSYREDKNLPPINCGVMMVHQKGCEAGQRFFEKVYQTIQNQTYSFKHLWHSEQLAISAMIGKQNMLERKSDLLIVEGIRILLLPCHSYNYSPPTSQPINAYIPNKKLVHFKGLRKIFMQAYWENFLKNKEHNE